MRTHVPARNTHKTQTVHTYCTHNTHLPTRLTTLARTLESSNNKQAKKRPKEVTLLEHVELFPSFFFSVVCVNSVYVLKF